MSGNSETRVYGDLLTTTMAEYEKTLADNVFDVYPLLSWVNGGLGEKVRKGKSIKKLVGSGESIVTQIMYGTNSTAKAYAGAEPMDTTMQEGFTRARYDWKQYAVTIGITGIDLRANNGEAALLDLLDSKVTQAEMSLRDLMNPHLFGNGTAVNSKSFTGLQAICSTTSTLGGLAPASYPVWKCVADTAGFSWAASGRGKLRTIYNNLSYGNDVPDAIFTDQTTFESVEASFEDKERIGTKGALDMGFDSIAYRGVMLTWDRDCPAGYMFLLNSKYLKFYVHKQANLKVGKFVQPFGQDVLSASIIFQANLTTNNRRMHGVISGITA